MVQKALSLYKVCNQIMTVTVSSKHGNPCKQCSGSVLSIVNEYQLICLSSGIEKTTELADQILIKNNDS